MRLPFNADKILKEIKNLKEIEAIAIHGSVAYGLIDRYSDLDLVCLCKKIPSVKTRETFLRKLVSKLNEDFDLLRNSKNI